MSLSFIGPGGSAERRWIVYALLRDNVQHHLEDGAKTEAFGAIHSMGEALEKGEVRVGAQKLRAEIERAEALLSRPIGDLAVSFRTRAVCAQMFPLPEARGTLLASEGAWQLPLTLQHAKTLGDVFGSLVLELKSITEGADAQTEITVIDS
jgi:hypothetical protein